MARYPTLRHTLRDQLLAIAPSHDYGMEYRPCTVTTKDDRTFEHVYVVAAQAYIRQWGVWPEDDDGKDAIAVQDIQDIRESGARLPPEFADQLYAAGESGMGYCIFTIVFQDGSRQVCTSGNAVDFIDYPAGKGPKDVAAVLPHEGRTDQVGAKGPPRYHWCLYESE